MLLGILMFFDGGLLAIGNVIFIGRHSLASEVHPILEEKSLYNF
jgi:hypothetical protein